MRIMLVSALAVLAASAQGGEVAGEKKAGARMGSPDYYLSMLERLAKPPDATRRFYEAAFRVLGSKTDAAYADLAADVEVQKLATENGIAHLGGPMLGALASDGARVWLRTLRPAKVEVVVTADGAEKRFGPVESGPKTDLTAVVPVTGLKPGTSCPYRVLVDGKPVTVSEGAAIVTAPGEAAPATVRIAFGTCPHVKGLGNAKLINTILGRKPAAMLLYGDVSAQDNGSHRGHARCGYLVREGFPSWRRLAASVPVYAAWDDHDYWSDDGWGIPRGCTAEDQQRTWAVFRHSWNNPAYGFGDERRGVFFRTRIGPCDVIMTDGRYFRKKGSLLGEEQMKWLEAQLLDCKGPFIVMSSGTMWSDYVDNGKDSWGVFDKEGRERIFSLIEKHRIPGVLLISGDRHGARGFRIPRPSGFVFYEFEPASLGGITGPKVTDPAWKDVQLFGFNSLSAFGEFTVDAKLPDPEVTFRLIKDDGKVLHEMKLKRSQLTPPPPGAAGARAIGSLTPRGSALDLRAGFPRLFCSSPGEPAGPAEVCGRRVSPAPGGLCLRRSRSSGIRSRLPGTSATSRPGSSPGTATGSWSSTAPGRR